MTTPAAPVHQGTEIEKATMDKIAPYVTVFIENPKGPIHLATPNGDDTLCLGRHSSTNSGPIAGPFLTAEFCQDCLNAIPVTTPDNTPIPF